MNAWKPDERGIRALEESLGRNSDVPVIADVHCGRTYSSRQLVDSIKRGSDFGIKIHNQYVALGGLE